MIHDKARVDAIRARMNVQLQLVDSLKAKIVKGNLDALDVARNQTEDIETFFLTNLDRNPRTPEQEAFWLSGAERMLQTWVSYLKQTEAQFSKFGDAGVEVIGG
jgi:hypothetical protein